MRPVCTRTARSDADVSVGIGLCSGRLTVCTAFSSQSREYQAAQPAWCSSAAQLDVSCCAVLSLGFAHGLIIDVRR